MFDSPPVMLLTGYCAAGLAGLAGCLIGAGLYDVREAKLRRNRQLQPYSKQNRYRPFICVIVYVSSAKHPLINCLQSIRYSSYRNYEIMVVDDTLTDGRTIKQRVKDFTSKYPKTDLQILQRRQKTTRQKAIAAGVNKATGAEVVLVLDAGSILDKQALRRACDHFNMDTKITALVPNIQIIPRQSIMGLIEEYDQLLRMIPKKLMSILGVNYDSAATNWLYRKPTGRYKPNNPSLQVKRIQKYASDVIIYREPAASGGHFLGQRYGQKLNASLQFGQRRQVEKLSGINTVNIVGRTRHIFVIILLQLLTILTPIVISYLLYLALNFKQSALFGLSWIIFSVVLLGVIWGKDHMKWQIRLRLTVLIPPMYSVFYILSFFQIGTLALASLRRKST